MFFAVQPTLSLAKIADTMHAQVMMIAALRRNTAAPKAFHENIETTSMFRSDMTDNHNNCYD